MERYNILAIKDPTCEHKTGKIVITAKEQDFLPNIGNVICIMYNQQQWFGTVTGIERECIPELN